MIIELHMLQSFAPSNLNRDDTNNPKDCDFGGVRRARISSQCIKRSIRQSPVFSEVTAAKTGERTRWMTRLLSEALEKAGKDPQQVKAVATALAQAYAGKMDKKQPERTSVLLYLSAGEIDMVTRALLDNWDALVAESGKNDAKAFPLTQKVVDDLIKETKNRTSAPDIALFGRMLADKPELNLDAACQVAHAISTHRVTMDMDFYTAVDDLSREDEAGAGMMGFTSFNSACFYRFSLIHWDLLVRNLDGDTDLARRTVEGYLRAAVQAVPTGKQNTFAAHNPPSFLLVVVRKNGSSWSLANAFEKPVQPSREGGLVAPSASALDGYWGRLVDMFGDRDLVYVGALPLEPGLSLANLKDRVCPNLDAWVTAAMQALPGEA